MSAYTLQKYGETRIVQRELKAGEIIETTEGIITIKEPCVVDVEEVFSKSHYSNRGFWWDRKIHYETIRPINVERPDTPMRPLPWYKRLFGRTNLPKATLHVK